MVKLKKKYSIKNDKKNQVNLDQFVKLVTQVMRLE
jgi:hypothetical protein